MFAASYEVSKGMVPSKGSAHRDGHAMKENLNEGVWKELDECYD